MRTTRNPILLDHGGPDLERPSPMLGEHSEAVLRELGYAPAAIRDLVASGVTRSASPPGTAKIAAAE
jgi:crotonobetainyl-CoA:carnitine CoA-transferase CaiB-like acyl-CoA transferase